jgi:hypothetical protein
MLEDKMIIAVLKKICKEYKDYKKEINYNCNINQLKKQLKIIVEDYYNFRKTLNKNPIKNDSILLSEKLINIQL